MACSLKICKFPIQNIFSWETYLLLSSLSEKNLRIIVFMNFCFHNHWWSLPFASAVIGVAFSKKFQDFKKTLRSLRVENCKNRSSNIISKMKRICFNLHRCANNGTVNIAFIINRVVVVDQILNFMFTLVEKSDIFMNFPMSQLMINQVHQGNISSE